MAATSSIAPLALGTVLVVGGCGFLGSAVVDQLLNFPSEDSPPPPTPSTLTSFPIPSLRSRYPSYDLQATKVHALDLRCTHNIYKNCTYHSADITSPTALLEVFRQVQPDVIINTASPQYSSPAAILRKVNIDGTRTLLEVAGGAHGDWGGSAKIFVHTSSSSVIHDAESDLIYADERYPYVCPNPKEYYSETKVYGERLVLEANNKSQYGNMLTCAVRPAGITGEGDLGGISYGVLKNASEAPLWQLHIQLGDGNTLFDTTYVHNVVYGLLCCANALLLTFQRRAEGKVAPLEHERVDGEAFIVTNSQPAYFWDTTRFLYSRYGRQIDGDKVWALPKDLALVVGGITDAIGWVTGRKGKLTRQNVKYSCMHRYYSCDKLQKRTGYAPIVDVEEGLARSVRWFKGVYEVELKERQEGRSEKKSQ